MNMMMMIFDVTSWWPTVNTDNNHCKRGRVTEFHLSLSKIFHTVRSVCYSKKCDRNWRKEMSQAYLGREATNKIKRTDHEAIWGSSRVAVTLWALRPGDQIIASGKSFRPHNGPRVHSASSRNEYQGNPLGGKGVRCVGLKTLPHSCAECLEILRASTAWSLKGLSRHVMG